MKKMDRLMKKTYVMYENSIYIVEQNLNDATIINKKTLLKKSWVLDHKNLIEEFIKVIKSDDNHQWLDEVWEEIMKEEISINTLKNGKN